MFVSGDCQGAVAAVAATTLRSNHNIVRCPLTSAAHHLFGPFDLDPPRKGGVTVSSRRPLRCAGLTARRITMDANTTRMEVGSALAGHALHEDAGRDGVSRRRVLLDRRHELARRDELHGRGSESRVRPCRPMRGTTRSTSLPRRQHSLRWLLRCMTVPGFSQPLITEGFAWHCRSADRITGAARCLA
jgi:hypothetical protein